MGSIGVFAKVGMRQGGLGSDSLFWIKFKHFLQKILGQGINFWDEINEVSCRMI